MLDDDQNNTPLCSSSCGQTEVVQCLISDFGCNPNVQGKRGMSLLHLAVVVAVLVLVQRLIREHC